ncbi:MAG: hypothetical protein AAGC53_01275 [Actinomycetota bacterium]
MTTETRVDLVAERYEPLVDSSRKAFFTSATITTLSDPNAAPNLLDRFLIQYCARGVQMTEPVDGWIRRAGAATSAAGHVELGEALQRHAVHEAGHHEMMIADTHALIERWNRDHPEAALAAGEILDQPVSPGVQAYIDLHESVIAGTEPFAQIAIEYEIELLSITAGPMLMGNVARVCGADRIGLLSFLNDHIELDQGHTVFNRRQMNRFLADHPAAVASLAQSGSAALDAYGQFLTDCLEAAR